MKSLTIGSNVNNIGHRAFYSCTGVTSIYCNAVNPPACSFGVFDMYTQKNCTLYVPSGSVDAYKAANVWKDFVNIQAIGETGIANIVINNNVPFDVYDINGRKIRNRVKTIEGLPKGLYIVNGKRILIH